MLTKSLCACVMLTAVPLLAEARPVSYPGGWTVIQTNNGDGSALLVHYSPTVSDSFGLYTERDWSEDVSFTGVQYTRLINRWNKPGEQANVYTFAGVGMADHFGAEVQETGGYAGIMADWETRRWFTGYEGRINDYGDGAEAKQSVHLGIAPYLGDEGDLHTWVMLDITNKPESAETLTFTPTLRFFQGVTMAEIGYTLEEQEFMFNWIYRF